MGAVAPKTTIPIPIVPKIKLHTSFFNMPAPFSYVIVMIKKDAKNRLVDPKTIII
jgi:hypothetical protein